MTAGEPNLRWSVVIPFKGTSSAKSRLEDLPNRDRIALARAFALDTVQAAVGCPDVDRVLVVTADVATMAGAAPGAEVVAEAGIGDVNAAVRQGVREVRRRWPGTPVAVLTGDLPALTSAALSAALTAAPASRWFVSDVAGEGTTLLAAAPGAALVPRFGVRSASRHRESGAVELRAPGLERLRRDVDTRVDLREAVELGVGAHTSRTWAALDVRRPA